MCDLLESNRGDKCATSAGNSYVLFWNKVDAPFTVVNGEATAINAALTEVYKYAIVPDTSTFEAVKTVDATAGKGCITTLELQLRQTDAATNFELDKMGTNTQCAIVDRQGQIKAMAIDEGFKTFTATLTHGDGTRQSLQGYTLNAVAETNDLPPVLDSTTATALIALIA